MKRGNATVQSMILCALYRETSSSVCVACQVCHSPGHSVESSNYRTASKGNDSPVRYIIEERLRDPAQLCALRKRNDCHALESARVHAGSFAAHAAQRVPAPAPPICAEALPGDTAATIGGRAGCLLGRFSWFGQSRRLAKEYERLCATSEAMIYATRRTSYEEDRS